MDRAFIDPPTFGDPPPSSKPPTPRKPRKPIPPIDDPHHPSAPFDQKQG
jgi:hypothetical protein